MSTYTFYKDSNLERPRSVSYEQFTASEYGTKFSYAPSDTLYNFYYFSSSADFGNENYRKLKSLKNFINRNSGYDDLFNYDNFYNVTSSIIAFNNVYLGSGLQKGSLSLRIYVSGTLLDEATDAKENGILSSSLSGKVGIVLYKEGFILLNKNTALTASTTSFQGVQDSPRWTNFMGDDADTGEVKGELSYLYVNSVPTNVIFATANKNELNHSNNITYVKSGSYVTPQTSSTYFKENNKLEIKNIVKSPFVSGSANFEKETYITKIGLYDKDRQLIGYATLANPVRKTENREFIFKLKLDI
jgi:hypothetical protein